MFLRFIHVSVYISHLKMHTVWFRLDEVLEQLKLIMVEKKRSSCLWGRVGVERNKRELSGVMVMFCILVGVWVAQCMHFSEFSEWSTLDLCVLLYANFTLKEIKENCKFAMDYN